jgi:hypothetical protein
MTYRLHRVKVNGWATWQTHGIDCKRLQYALRLANIVGLDDAVGVSTAEGVAVYHGLGFRR